MVWNDEIHDEELDDEEEDGMEFAISDAIKEIYKKAREAGLFEPEFLGKDVTFSEIGFDEEQVSEVFARRGQLT